MAPTSAGKSFISFYAISHVIDQEQLPNTNNTNNTNNKNNNSKGDSKRAIKKEQKGKKKEKEKEKEKQDIAKATQKPKGIMNSRVVFVAPTLPLCNQMVAMVKHRYCPLFLFLCSTIG